MKRVKNCIRKIHRIDVNTRLFIFNNVCHEFFERKIWIFNGWKCYAEGDAEWKPEGTKFLEMLDVRTYEHSYECTYECTYMCFSRGHCFGQGRSLQVNALFTRSLSSALHGAVSRKGCNYYLSTRDISKQLLANKSRLSEIIKYHATFCIVCNYWYTFFFFNLIQSSFWSYYIVDMTIFFSLSLSLSLSILFVKGRD